MTPDATRAATRVLIADDQALVRRGFRMILDIEPDLEVVGEAADGVEAVARARDARTRRRAHGRPDAGGRRHRGDPSDSPRTTGVSAKVIMLTTFDMDDYVYDALQAGASGFLLKDVQPELLVAGIHAVHAGESLLAPDDHPTDDRVVPQPTPAGQRRRQPTAWPRSPSGSGRPSSSSLAA